jgi:para-aminobenzoate synthetase/4-amino-4-deoxychorismate lyase
VTDQPAFLLQTPSDGWLQLERPTRVLVADSPSEVRACLDDAEAAARGGAYAAGFVTYEAAAAFGLAVHPSGPGALPLAYFAVYPTAHARRPDWRPREGQSPNVGGWTPSVGRDGYLAALLRIKDFIADGDTYQLNYTFRLRAPFSGDARQFFDRLAHAQGGAWSAFVDLGDHVICSASPELFFRRDGNRLECRPMKGTAARGLTAGDDRARASALAASAKNRSENVMIVDLIRNDLGRVARVGSVQVASLFDMERYPAQWQMTSTVVAEATGVSIADIFAALFPSGSVTGAPKVRSMEIARELETSPRGIYTGAIGLIAPGGRAHFNVAIRTAVVDRALRIAEFGVGSGIVWESRGEDEFEECQMKAAILTERAPVFDLLETLRWDPATGYALEDRHMARLAESADYFGFGDVTEGSARALEAAVAGRLTPARVRLLVDGKGQARTEVTDMVARPEPLRVALATAPVTTDNRFLYHKTTDRSIYDEARRTRPEADTVLLWNREGEITESLDANVVVELDGDRVTPPVSCGLLAGTMRADLLARGEIVERRITLEDLGRASRVWLVNSVRGWMEVQLLPPAPAA